MEILQDENFIFGIAIGLFLGLLISSSKIFKNKLSGTTNEPQNENNSNSSGNEVLGLSIQAYERAILFLERISPLELIQKPKAVSGLNMYHQALVNDIRMEYEHNATQQLYISENLWERLISDKNFVMALLNTAYRDSINDGGQISDYKQKFIENHSKTDHNHRETINLLKKELKIILRKM